MTNSNNPSVFILRALFMLVFFTFTEANNAATPTVFDEAVSLNIDKIDQKFLVLDHNVVSRAATYSESIDTSEVIFSLTCPPDTTISCTVLITPSFTGLPIVEGYGFVSFVDSIIQRCPDDIILERSWIAGMDSLLTIADTCTQRITVIVDKLEDFKLIDTLMFDGICLTSLNDPILEGLNLPCNLGIDSIRFELLENTCSRKVWEGAWTFGDQCRDTSVQFKSIIISNNPPVVDFRNIVITPDSTEQSTGGIMLEPGCKDGPLTYLWSNGDTDTAIVNVSSGNYSVIVTNDFQCSDTFNFAVAGRMQDTVIFTLTCPPDTTLNCGHSVIDLPWGTATFSGYDSLSFVERLISTCPDDQVFTRTYYAYTNDMLADSCSQSITIVKPDIASISNVSADTIVLRELCVEELAGLRLDLPSLVCDFVVVSDSIVLDSIATCQFLSATRTIAVRSECLDTMITIQQPIIIENLKFVTLDSSEVNNVAGSSLGSIEVFISTCSDTDSLSLSWSTGANGTRIDSLAAGSYDLSITNSLGCIASFSFTVNQLDSVSFILTCPPDTTLNCGHSVIDLPWGTATFSGYDSLSFVERLISTCPDDQVFTRTYYAYTNDMLADSCSQSITIVKPDIASISNVSADTIVLRELCVEELAGLRLDLPSLVCDFVVVSDSIVLDSIATCQFLSATRTIAVRSECLDTMITIQQPIIIENLKFVTLDSSEVNNVAGSSLGSIEVFISTCSDTDSLSLSWSTGANGTRIDSLAAGSYDLSITNSLGCIASFSFTVNLIDTVERTLICPPDITLACGSELNIEITGEPVIIGYDAFAFRDSVMTQCPEDMIVQRTWVALLNGAVAESCVQQFTVEASDLNSVDLRPVVTYANICLDEIDNLPIDQVELSCDITLLSIETVDTSTACDNRQLTRLYQFYSMCRDTIFTMSQEIRINNIRVSRFRSANIDTDDGMNSGRISLSVSSCSDSLRFSWSSGSMDSIASGLRAGNYTVTVSNEAGCSDTYDFTVPLDPNAVLDTMLELIVVDREGIALSIDSVIIIMENGEQVQMPFMQQDSQVMVMGTIPLSDVKEVCIIRNDEAIRGITVSDLIKGQLSIIGLARSCPEDLVAGDINLSGTLTGADLVLMRNLLLGRITSFPSGVSWVFVNEDLFPVRPVVSNPICVPLTAENKLSGVVHIKGIKLGDFMCTE